LYIAVRGQLAVNMPLVKIYSNAMINFSENLERYL